MTSEYKVYLNGYYFTTLADAVAFGDRPEPYRNHERALWTIYQLLKLDEHEVAIADQVTHLAFSTRKADELQRWIQEVYPAFASQLDQPVYTRFPHPDDAL